MRKINQSFYQRIQLPFKIKKPVLALGSQTKNSVCLARGNYAYISPGQRDLGNLQDFLSFAKEAKYFLKQHPEIIAYDLHPEYQSSKYALSLQLKAYSLKLVQHHHAHIAACMAENGLKNQKVIGIAFDGTGLGSDNTLWGGEFLLCDYKKFFRAAHLKEIPLLGGERAILEPWRLLAAWIGLVRGKNKKKWQILRKLYIKGINAPLSSSMGRLFDAAASLLLAKDKAEFEAQLAIDLEKLAMCNLRLSTQGYKFKITKKQGAYIIDPVSVLRQMALDLKSKESKEKVAYRFHLSIAEMIRQMSIILRKDTGIDKVVLSGGVFQNNLLLKQVLDLLYKEDFRVYIHKRLSCNDSGISLGQAVIAGARCA